MASFAMKQEGPRLVCLSVYPTMMMMMFTGTESLVTQLENEMSRVHATGVPAIGQNIV